MNHNINTVGSIFGASPCGKSFLSKFLRLHTLIARVAAIYLTYSWYMFFVHSKPFHLRYSAEYLIRLIPYCALYSLGLWLSTTTWGKRHRILTSVLLVSTLVASPMITPNIFGAVAIFCLALWSYWRLFSSVGKESS
jgi:hypothetical protein